MLVPSCECKGASREPGEVLGLLGGVSGWDVLRRGNGNVITSAMQLTHHCDASTPTFPFHTFHLTFSNCDVCHVPPVLAHVQVGIARKARENLSEGRRGRCKAEQGSRARASSVVHDYECATCASHILLHASVVFLSEAAPKWPMHGRCHNRRRITQAEDDREAKRASTCCTHGSVRSA